MGKFLFPGGGVDVRASSFKDEFGARVVDGDARFAKIASGGLSIRRDPLRDARRPDRADIDLLGIANVLIGFFLIAERQPRPGEQPVGVGVQPRRKLRYLPREARGAFG